MSSADDIVRYSESVYLSQCHTGGPRHIVSVQSMASWSRHPTAACPARPPALGAEGPMYLDDALESEGLCSHCTEAIRRAQGRRKPEPEVPA